MVSMAAMVPSATPPQLDSVGLWATRIPRSVAASTSTSSVPIVYLATMRRRSELSMIVRLMGALRIDVPISASQPRAISTISASLLPCGVSQDALPRISSQPFSSSFRWVSAASATGAKIRTLATLMVIFPSGGARAPALLRELVRVQLSQGRQLLVRLHDAGLDLEVERALEPGLGDEAGAGGGRAHQLERLREHRGIGLVELLAERGHRIGGPVLH